MVMETKKNNLKRGWVFLTLFAILILAGIANKRLFHNPDMMVFFHLPGAICLVIAGHQLSTNVRAKYRQTLLEFQQRRQNPV